MAFDVEPGKDVKVHILQASSNDDGDIEHCWSGSDKPGGTIAMDVHHFD
jgi:hypothetical protein